MEQKTLPVGKLPADLLAHCLAQTPVNDPRVIVGPGIGMDCAVVEAGSSLWVIKSDPITFVTDEIGWYVVQINANDIATTGAVPRGHTEITHGLDRPIVVGALIGEVDRDHLITPRGAQLGDRILLTKGVPIEATAILAREFPDQLSQTLTPEELTQGEGIPL